MGVITTILSLLLVSVVSFEAFVNAKPLFLCDDGQTVLLTDRESQGCPEYAPQTELITVPEGSTWADIEWAVAITSPEAYEPRPESTQTARVPLSDLCREWVDLNLRTRGGVGGTGFGPDGASVGQSTQDRQRYVELNRIVSATNLCEGYIYRESR